jgi:iron(III) transport system ATP-binding protein
MVRSSPGTDGNFEVTSLTVSGLHKSFGSQPVLTGVDLDVPEGSLTALLGPSGSGKTTLLRVIAGFERADRGTISIGDRMVDGHHHAVAPEQRGIGYVPQEGSLFPHLTVAANISFGVHRRNGRRGKRRRLRPDASASDLLDMVGLSGLGARYPHQLSGGQQQRVALARALAIHPLLVLLDEPFSSLDAGLRSNVRSDVQDVLRRGGITAVLVTHDQDEALSVADQVAVIRNGRIGQFGTPPQLYDHPTDPDMARFLGDANLVRASIEGDGVDTPFGRLALRGDGRAAAVGDHVVALVRPEQLLLSVGTRGVGMPGKVIRTQFHGHDTLVTVIPEPPEGRDPVTVRASGDLEIADGTAVEVTATGSVVTWPARDH